MARRNMFRDRKQAVVILGSFFVVLTVFLCVNAVVRGNDAKNILNQISSCDITVKKPNNSGGEAPSYYKREAGRDPCYRGCEGDKACDHGTDDRAIPGGAVGRIL